MQLRRRVVQVFWLDGVIAPMHAVRFVTHNLHSRCGIHPCSPEIGTGRMAEIVDSQVHYSSAPTGSLECGSYPLNWLLFIQEYPICVQSPLPS
jgi:hypothetical protein